MTPDNPTPDSCAASSQQVGGDHYKGMAIQPAQYIHANGIGYLEGNVIKYVSRWQKKGGLEDLRKARHYIDLLLEYNGEPQAFVVKSPDPEPSVLATIAAALRRQS